MSTDQRPTMDDGPQTMGDRHTLNLPASAASTIQSGRSVFHTLSSIVNRLPSPVYPALILLLGLIVISPLFQPGYFWGAHDARHDVYFIFEYDKAVQNGIWLPGWGPDWAFGYGYPFWIVYGPLATFVGELFHHFLALGFEQSVKAVLGLSILLSGLAMYGFVRSWLGRAAGLVAAIAYMAIPYHLVDVFVRAAMAESVALVFLPLALWGFRETVVRPRLTAIIGAAFAYAAIMWTSNLVALIFTPGLAVYVLMLLVWQSSVVSSQSSVVSSQSSVVSSQSSVVSSQSSVSDRPSSIVHRLSSVGGRRSVVGQLFRSAAPPLIAIALGLGLSAAFFIPALIEQRYINQTQWFGKYYDPFQHFVYFFQLFSPAWGFGISQPGPVETTQGGMSYQLGAAATLFSLIALVVAGWQAAARRREVWFWGVWAAVTIFLTLGASAWAWRHVPLVPYAQFPWRYLMLAILPLSILPGTLMADSRWQIPDSTSDTETIRHPLFAIRNPLWPALLLSALLILSSAPYFKVEMREPTKEQGPVSMAALMRFERTSDEMTGVTAWVDPNQIPNWSPLADEWVAGREIVTRADYSKIPQDKTLAVNAEGMGSQYDEVWYYAEASDQSITFNRFWYPGWTAYLLDGKHGKPVQRLEVHREDGPLARIVVPVPPGQGYLLLRFEDTPLRLAAKAISLATLVLVVVLLVVYTGKQRRTSTA